VNTKFFGLHLLLFSDSIVSIQGVAERCGETYMCSESFNFLVIAERVRL
jgi:hypothetical protein